MAKETHASKSEMPVITSNGIFEVRSVDWDGYTVTFFKIKEDWNPSPLLFKGLPEDRCQAPHYGYVFKGTFNMKYKDSEETVNAGEAFYTKPGHIPTHAEKGTEFLQISPKEEQEKTRSTVLKNMKEMQAKKPL